MRDDLHELTAVFLRDRKHLCEVRDVLESGAVGEVREQHLDRCMQTHAVHDLLELPHDHRVRRKEMRELADGSPEGIFRGVAGT